MKRSLLNTFAFVLPIVGLAITIINDYVQGKKLEEDTKDLIDERLDERLKELKDEEA